MHLPIIYQDQHIVVINKPHGLLVHRTPIAADATEFALQILRDQIGQKVYPVHRIDRKTSGVLIFALDTETNAVLGKAFADRTIDKKYLAILRGWPSLDENTIDAELTTDEGKVQDAITHYKVIDRVELNIPFGRYQTCRYSLVQATPKTGRMHQIRKHFNKIRYPIIGDRPHGCSKQNKFWKERWQMTSMMLHSQETTIRHPATEDKLVLRAGISNEMKRVLEILGIDFSTMTKIA